MFIISVVTDDDTLIDSGFEAFEVFKFLKVSASKQSKMPNCVGISNWDHFLISKKANFVSCAAAIHDHTSKRKTGGEKY